MNIWTALGDKFRQLRQFKPRRRLRGCVCTRQEGERHAAYCPRPKVRKALHVLTEGRTMAGNMSPKEYPNGVGPRPSAPPPKRPHDPYGILELHRDLQHQINHVCITGEQDPERRQFPEREL